VQNSRFGLSSIQSTTPGIFGMAAVKGKVVEGGRIIVPASFRKSMGIAKGDTVFMELHGDELRRAEINRRSF
jgi:bifunctional DNA-binding transcriptional regulator/antitoxin component of YhaV-PrlF toxin-antitoxin module